jgi:predicted TIM-barrel enzyme
VPLLACPGMFIFHAGITCRGFNWYAGNLTLEETAKRSQAHFEIAKKIRSEVILLAHRAALINLEDAQYVLNHTDCHGVQLALSRVQYRAPGY